MKTEVPTHEYKLFLASAGFMIDDGSYLLDGF